MRKNMLNKVSVFGAVLFATSVIISDVCASGTEIYEDPSVESVEEGWGFGVSVLTHADENAPMVDIGFGSVKPIVQLDNEVLGNSKQIFKDERGKRYIKIIDQDSGNYEVVDERYNELGIKGNVKTDDAGVEFTQGGVKIIGNVKPVCGSFQFYDESTGRCVRDEKAEEEARIKAEEEARIKAEEEAKRKAEEEAAAQRAAEEAAAAQRAAEEEAAAQRAAAQQPPAQQIPQVVENPADEAGAVAPQTVGAAVGQGDGSSGELQATTTTKTITNEGETTDTQTGDLSSSSGSGGEGSGAAPEDAAAAEQASQNAEEAAEKTEEGKSKDGQEPEDLSKYTGLFNGRHIIPDEMAKHCRITGEAVAQDPEEFIKCIRQYVSEMNNPNATAKAEAEKEYEMLKYKFLTDAGSTAMTKSVATTNNSDTIDKTSDAQSKGRTESDDNKTIMASGMLSVNVLNDIRELLVEQLKFDVVGGIGEIDPAIIMEQEEPKEKAKGDDKAASGGDAKGPQYKATNVDVKIEEK